MSTSKCFRFACVAVLLPAALSAQDEPATIVGNLNDGTLLPPPPKTPLPQFRILESSVKQLPDRKLIVHRVAGSGVPDPMAPPAAIPAQTPDAREPRQPIVLTATVVDRKASLLTWWHAGTEYKAWSSVDFNYLTVFTGVRKGGNVYNTILMVANMPASDREGRSRYDIPASLQSDVPSFIVVQGDAADQAAMAPIEVLHEVYRLEGQRLRDAWDLHAARTKEREAAIQANPPPKKDIIIYHRRVRPSAARGGSK